VSYAETPTLRNDLVVLEQLDPGHEKDLAQAVTAEQLVRTWYASVPDPEQMAGEIRARLALQSEGRLAPWAILDTAAGRAVGMTTYLNLDEPNRRLEIGSTWIGPRAQGTGINPAAKLLLLRRAFETLGCVAVEFRTDWHNHASRAAIARLGAKQDGVLRNHKVRADGTLRDTVVFSVLEHEWPSVRVGLEARVARHR